MESMGKIRSALETMVEPGVSVQKLIILSAELTDERMDDFQKEIKGMNTNIENMSETITDSIHKFKMDVMEIIGGFESKVKAHNEDCPLNTPELIEQLDKEVEKVGIRLDTMDKKFEDIGFMFYFVKYKKLGIATLIGLIFMCLASGYGLYESIEARKEIKNNAIKIEKNNVDINKQPNTIQK